MESTPLALYGIAARPRMASAVRLYSSYLFSLDYIPPAVDSMLAEARFHTATGCGFHARLCRDFSKAFLSCFFSAQRRLVRGQAHASVPNDTNSSVILEISVKV